MTTLLPSPPSSEDMASAFYARHASAAAAVWSATPLTSLPGFCLSHAEQAFEPETPPPDSSASWDSHQDSRSPAEDTSRTSSVNVTASGRPVAALSNDVCCAVVVSSSTAGSGSCGATKRVVPHREKPPHLVARRNARERRRVEAVNSAFSVLRKCVPVENRAKRLSKVKTLHKAIEYIYALQGLLDEADKVVNVPVATVPDSDPGSTPEAQSSQQQQVVKIREQQHNERWVNLENVGYGTDSYQSFLNYYEQSPASFAT
ncbi:uncharacterized protein LOC144103220 [Amblyomma americanum]